MRRAEIGPLQEADKDEAKNDRRYADDCKRRQGMEIERRSIVLNPGGQIRRKRVGHCPEGNSDRGHGKNPDQPILEWPLLGQKIVVRVNTRGTLMAPTSSMADRARDSGLGESHQRKDVR